MISQLHALLLVIPGGAKKSLSAAQAEALLATVRPRDVVGKTRRRVAAELIADLERVYARKKAADKELKELVAATGTSLLDLHGIGPSGAARLLVEVADITRFPTRDHFASWNGTAPIDASSGDNVRHRLSRAGNRQINRTLHIMATVQLRDDTEGRRYTTAAEATGPGGQRGSDSVSSATGSQPNTGSSDKPLRGPSHPSLERPCHACLDTEGSQKRLLEGYVGQHLRVNSIWWSARTRAS